MTSCHRLPGIVASGGIMSFQHRRQLGVEEDASPHYWGSADKKDALSGYVVCAFMTPWWMCRKRDEELAILLLDAEAVCTKPGVCFCPTNSAFNLYPAAMIVQRTGAVALDECFENETTYQAGSSEVFVPDVVPLSDFRGIVCCDREAGEYWIEQLNAAYDELPEPRPTLPEGGPIPVASRGREGFYFPGDFTPRRRIRH